MIFDNGIPGYYDRAEEEYRKCSKLADQVIALYMDRGLSWREAFDKVFERYLPEVF